MGSLVGYRFQPTPEELVSHFLKNKKRDPAFTDLTIKEVNIYKHHPCELPGLASIQSDEQVWYFFCTLDNKYAKSDRASRTAKGGSWKKTGVDRKVKAKDSNNPIGIKKTLVFYKGSSTKKENKTNWTMQEYHEYPCNKDPRFKDKVVVCRIEKKADKKHEPSSAFDGGQPSRSLVYDPGNNVAQHIVPEVPLPQTSSDNQVANKNLVEVELLPSHHIRHVTKFLQVEPPVPANWDALIGCDNELDRYSFSNLQSPIFSENSYVWNTPKESDQEDDFWNPQYAIQDEFFGKETGHASETVAEAPTRDGSDEAAETVATFIDK
ncbi:hypothetical protein ACOSP7_024315 [Xanthoceras sorbifolium]|uniref:NAC domain-containing protein n=1 Tax=Xanthoceras sorbifolium TaxID=99658 RepID=A0ABQ8H922_9ROSI|nr:hypothetical protein JRO89_XS13G0183700 [Xanthoceras sorbifolium]